MTACDVPHGTRPLYQRGCRCLPCRAAEATYRANLRRRHLRGLPILGALVSPVEANRRIRQLRREGYTPRRIAIMAGWAGGHLPSSQHMRLLTVLRIRRVAAFAMLEGVDVSDGMTFDSLNLESNN